MRLAVIGNGPSAKGHGVEIDACDFVVRMKAWWKYGAEDAGSRCDALVHYGLNYLLEYPEFKGEHWFSQNVSRLQGHADCWERLSFLVRTAEMRAIHWFPEAMWKDAERKLNRHPSSGFIAVYMAMAIKQPDELLLYGFDGTTPDRPNYTDANGPLLPASLMDNPPHDQLAEKRAIAEILTGIWMNQPTATKLIWPDMPELE